MNTTTFKNRIKSLYTKKKELHNSYYKPMDFIKTMVKKEKVYPLKWSRNNGRYTLIGDNHLERLKTMCKLLKIKLSFGNSGQGGKEKDYVYLENREIQKLKQVEFSKIYKYASE